MYDRVSRSSSHRWAGRTSKHAEECRQCRRELYRREKALSHALLLDRPALLHARLLLLQFLSLSVQLVLHLTMCRANSSSSLCRSLLSFSCTFCWNTIFISVSIFWSFCSCSERSSSCLTAGLTSLNTLDLVRRPSGELVGSVVLVQQVVGVSP